MIRVSNLSSISSTNVSWELEMYGWEWRSLWLPSGSSQSNAGTGKLYQHLATEHAHMVRESNLEGKVRLLRGGQREEPTWGRGRGVRNNFSKKLTDETGICSLYMHKASEVHNSFNFEIHIWEMVRKFRTSEKVSGKQGSGSTKAIQPRGERQKYLHIT